MSPRMAYCKDPVCLDSSDLDTGLAYFRFGPFEVVYTKAAWRTVVHTKANPNEDVTQGLPEALSIAIVFGDQPNGLRAGWNKKTMTKAWKKLIIKSKMIVNSWLGTARWTYNQVAVLIRKGTSPFVKDFWANFNQ